MTFETFDDLIIAPVSKQVARDMIVANHYSHKWGSTFGLENFGVFRDNRLLGVAVYGCAMNHKSWHAITTVDAAHCIELNRLWIDDELGANTETWVLSQSMKRLQAKGYRLVQSFADGRLGVGTMYQAANFGYYGSHRTVFHEDTDTGELLHNTQFSNTANVTGMVSRNRLHAEGRLTTFTVNTYRYLFPLDRGARRSIRLKQQPYPKERLGLVTLTDYRPPVSQVARATAMAEASGDIESVNVLGAYLATLTDTPEEALASQRENRWVKRIASKTQLATPLF